jgi:2-iminoacetate synthase ThiH
MIKMDPKLVAKEQGYEVSYFARKHSLSNEEAMKILKEAGVSRVKADALAEERKGADNR